MSTTDDAVRVGVLSLHNSKETKAILNAVEDLGHEPVWLRRENAAVSIEDGEVTVEPEVDIIANRLLLSNTEEPAELLGLATTFNRIRPMLNEPDAVLAAIHKFATAATLANWNIQVPDALLAPLERPAEQGPRALRRRRRLQVRHRYPRRRDVEGRPDRAREPEGR